MRVRKMSVQFLPRSRLLSCLLLGREAQDRGWLSFLLLVAGAAPWLFVWQRTVGCWNELVVAGCELLDGLAAAGLPSVGSC
ncbi:hypothetical protein E3N88_12971 [Mikania micrantha]|uniref:Uncharacterized protein n=1 Tax=Mikania micrantha TaxID=192012 RepID=A0A5N6P8U8_9ASTR|nr:hypothetical protein E3N88_12971 [Mikania micrantha]